MKFTKEMTKVLYDSCINDNLYIPYGITELEEDFLYKGKGSRRLSFRRNTVKSRQFYPFKKIFIPETVTKIHRHYSEGMFQSKHIDAIEVDVNNKYYCSIDGVLFTKNKKILLYYPPGKFQSRYCVPEGTKCIFDYAFKNSSLQVIILPKSFLKMEAGALDQTDIGSIKIDENNEHYCSIDGVLFSKDKETLIRYPIAKTENSYFIPNGTKHIAANAFYHCTLLKDIEIPKSMKRIDKEAFQFSDISYISVNENNENFCSIFGVLFSKDKNTLLNIPNSYKDDYNHNHYFADFLLDSLYVYYYDFLYTVDDLYYDLLDAYYCYICDIDFDKKFDEYLDEYFAHSLDASYSVPTGTKYIETSTLENSFLLSEINLPESISGIAQTVIDGYSCTVTSAPLNVDEDNKYYYSLNGVLFCKGGFLKAKNTLISYPSNKHQKSYSVPEKTYCISTFAFYGSYLESINLPKSLETIEIRAFNNCWRLSTISVNKDNENFCSVDGVLYSKDRKTLLYYPSGRFQSSYTILEGTKYISSFAFDKVRNLKNVNLPKSLIYITMPNFNYCYIRSIDIDKYNTQYCLIDDVLYSKNMETLIYCTGMHESYMIPKETKYINDFSVFKNLEEMQTDENNKHYCSVDGVLFSKDKRRLIHYPRKKSQKSYIVPEGTLFIEEYAFSYNDFLTDINFPESLLKIEDKAFYRCKYLIEIKLSDRIEYTENKEYGPCVIKENKHNIIYPKPYFGDKEYIFVSYAHKDSDEIIRVIIHLKNKGFRIWYDEGIDPGTEWDVNIADHIDNCSYFIAFISKFYLESVNCKDEITYARNQSKKILLIYLDDIKLPNNMEMRLGRLQAIYKNRYVHENEFMEKLLSAQGIEKFCDSFVSE